MTHPNAELITRFYQAFQQLDAETMASCYSEGVQFSDPVFTDLRGAEAGDMWRFRDGKIAEHRDHFDLWRWAGQALGIKGLLLGWTPFVQNAIRQQAAKGLAAFQKSR